ncbi:hypothetical protein VZT92_003331 [Zoarces viviparus]|uniref:Uncharacterized protein n=1 Tax=Zoarces viviparus TaxID=48416 RepID=A0AAW1G259_ZOAVI
MKDMNVNADAGVHRRLSQSLVHSLTFAADAQRLFLFKSSAERTNKSTAAAAQVSAREARCHNDRRGNASGRRSKRKRREQEEEEGARGRGGSKRKRREQEEEEGARGRGGRR